MDEQQKKVLRWKRHLVAKSVEWSDDFVTGLKQRDLLSDVVVAQIQVNAILYLLLYDSFGHTRCCLGLEF